MQESILSIISLNFVILEKVFIRIGNKTFEHLNKNIPC